MTIQYDKLRKKVDKKFIDAHDELTDTYYNDWKQGKLTKKFNEYAPTTQEEAKPLFDKLHGLIFFLHEQALDDENKKALKKDKYDGLEKKMTTPPRGQTETPRDGLVRKISELEIEGIILEI